MTREWTSRGWQVTGAVLLSLAVAWMLAPTYPMEWMHDPAVGAGLTTYHSWFDPMAPGYAAFHVPVLLLCGLVAAAGAWYGVWTGVPERYPAWWALAGIAAFMGWSLVIGFSALTLVPLLLLGVGAAGLLLATRRARPAVSAPAGRRSS